MKGKRFIFSIGVFLLLALVAGCAPAAPPAPTPAAPKTEGTPASPAPAPKKLEKAKIQTTQKTVSFVNFYFGRDKGFYRDEGVDLQIQEMKAPLGIPALLAGEIDYTGLSSTPFNAGLLGVPVKLLMNTINRPVWHILGAAGINSPQDLKGKSVAITSIGAAGHYATEVALTALGLDSKKDYTFVVIASGADQFAAIKSGAVAAASLTDPYDFQARESGFKELAFTADYLDLSIDGVGTMERRVKEKRDQVKGMLRGTVKTLQYIKKRENREEMIQYLVKELGLDRKVAEGTWDAREPTFSKDGMLSEKGLQNFIEMARFTGTIKKDQQVTANMGADLSLLKEVLKEMGVSQ